MVMTNYTIFTDGGSRGNPGPAAIGYIIYDPNKDFIAEGAEYIGIATNNQAEYQAIVAGLMKIKELDTAGSVTCYLDSELVVRQVNGIYKMKNQALKPWLQKIYDLKQSLGGHVTFHHVSREKNSEADALVNKALDAVEDSI
jgi:ribonuclease HI